MSNDPKGQSVMPRNEYESYPTTTMSIVVGDVKVGDKSYGIQGQVVDSTVDRPLDVNAIAGVQPASGNMQMPQSGILQEFEGHELEGPSDPVSENPEQTYSPATERKKGTY